MYYRMLPRKLTILYGSQTGNAQDIAERIWEDARRRHIESEIWGADEWDARKLESCRLLVIVCSTTGQGVLPSNINNLWNLLRRRSLSPKCLQHIKYAVLGLGDSSYHEFNFAAKKLFRRFEQLGAIAICPVALSDEQHDLGSSAVVEPWLLGFWSNVEILIHPSKEHIIPNTTILPSRYKVTWIANEPREHGIKMPLDERDSAIFNAKLVSNTRVTAEDHFQDTRLFEFDITGYDIEYFPGDVAEIHPENLEESINLAVEMLNLGHKLDHEFTLETQIEGVQLPPKWSLPHKCTIRQCLKRHWDLQCIPRTSFFSKLAQFSKDETERERLIELSIAEGQQELYSYCNRPRRTLVEVLQDFWRSAGDIPFDYLFDLIPYIRPRSFSIASSQLKHKNIMQLLVVAVRYKTRLVLPRLGLCSNWLARRKVGECIELKINKGSLKFPVTNSMILVGPGTGIAPFRSFLWQIAASNQCKQKIYLFFGCRSKLKDFYFEQEWNELQNILGVENFKYETAFSRDQTEKIYVQHLISSSQNIPIKELQSMDCALLIAGNAKDMPDDVIEAIKERVSDSQFDYVQQMRQKGIIIMETWS